MERQSSSLTKIGRLKRLATFVQWLKRKGELAEECDAIILEEPEEGIVEDTEIPTKGREIYISHKVVIREYAETTKMWLIVCDALFGACVRRVSSLGSHSATHQRL